MKLERKLELICYMGDDGFTVDIKDPLTGDGEDIQGEYLFDLGEHPEFNEAIGNCIMNYIDVWTFDEKERVEERERMYEGYEETDDY